MLRLLNINKSYKVADTMVPALKGIDLAFRKNEFVSILGPSGCGKTTLLNIIGGLDKYTEGDLFISGRSTKEFTDRDWDIYRNHRVGFIFQSYNLIPHQTILGNVELALTIAGISKQERIEKAKKALDRVGLKDQYYKKPNQLSGGQCQRVAIARALVNEPEILLADEPTGALDTVTSIQIMELIKEISNEKLVIMVTHNPELAKKYSSRIVKLLDGKVLEDSNPYSELDEQKETYVKEEVEEKAKMSFVTAFKLSARNLLSKMKRTSMVVVAGSIGIIGVSTVLAVSTGVKDYITIMQDDMLSGNPITISKSGVDYDALLDQSSLSDQREALEKGDWVNVNSVIQYLLGNRDVLTSLMYENEINMDYINYIKSMPEEYYQAISLNYGIDVTTNIYTDYKVEETSTYNKNISLHAITSTYSALIEELDEYKDYASMITSMVSTMSQGISNNDYISLQYDLVSGDLPKNSNDVLIVLDSSSELSDLLLAQLGYYTQDEFFNIVYKGLQDDPSFDGLFDSASYKMRFSYEELLEKDFYWYPNNDVYTKTTNEVSPFEYEYESKDTWNDGVKLNICGIVEPKETISYGALRTGFLYSEDFAREMIKINKESEIVRYINENGSIGTAINGGTQLTSVKYQLPYIFKDGRGNNEEKIKEVTLGKVQSGLEDLFGSFMPSGGSIPGVVMPYMIDSRMVGGEIIPSSISIYPLDFDNKYLVTDYLDKWNSDESVTYNVYSDDFKTVEEVKTLEHTYLSDGQFVTRNEIKYTDSIELIINMINTMINIITYALVAFTALSLLVSTVMVGIITYVSVVERIKEIGVIRSLGGRKKDVSHLFNAETFMIGLASGVFGIVITGILSFIINLIVKNVSNGAVNTISHLTFITSIVMIVLSVVLTLISGLIPAKSAARKNPVEALRSE